jgi:hypothetical protein
MQGCHGGIATKKTDLPVYGKVGDKTIWKLDFRFVQIRM